MTTWENFYEKYDEWADSTVLNRISSLQDIGPSQEIVDCANNISEEAAEKLVRKAISMGVMFTPNDIYELNGMISENLGKEILERYMTTGKPISVTEIQDLDALVPQESIDRAVLYDINLGLRFTPKQIIDLDGYVSQSVLTEALRRSGAKVTRDELEELDGVVDDKLLRKIDKKQNTHAFDDEDWDEYDDSYDYADTSGKKPGLLSHLGAFFVASEVNKRVWGDKDKDEYRSWESKPSKFNIGDDVYVRRYGKRNPGIIVNIELDGRYSVEMDDGLFFQGVRESEIERKGLFG